MPSDPDSGRRFSRREALAATGALGLGGALYVLLRGGGGGGDATAARTAAAVPTATPAATSGASCILTPEQTEGPYYIDNHLIRRDIREHHKGAPLELRLTVEDATTCKPLAGATVEVWHCDATGAYSGFGAQGGSSGRTFLRGGQRTGADGVATFKTIYPGWYQGRTTHIHVKVHVGGQVVHTGQLYFKDALTDAVYRRAPYAAHGTRAIRNAQDNIYANGGRQSTLAVRPRGSGYVGRITMGVKA